MSIYHIHHIIPKHMGGTNDPSNLIQLTVEEHAEAHKKLWEQYGYKQDYYAWKGLSGAIGKEEIIKGLISHPGKSNPFYGCKHTPETKKKMSEAKKGKYLGENNPLYGRKNPLLAERNKRGHSLEARNKMSEKRKGRIWIKKGDKQTLISLDEFEKYSLLGWVRGRCRS